MSMVLDQQPAFKHFCRICKRGFGCGRALGGHMRAHGIGDHDNDGLLIEDEEPAVAPSDWDSKRMYMLRTNPNRRLKGCRICEHCGKEFLSWKSFLEHGKCSSDDAESLLSWPGSGGEDGGGRRGCGSWSKGKRSRRARFSNFNSNCPSSEEEELANCLVMLSSARVDHHSSSMAEAEESCASASKEEEQHKYPAGVTVAPAVANSKAKGVAKRLFECKACKKVFNSHQALGGHRASHKMVKGCFAAKIDQDLDETLIDEEDVITHEDFLIQYSKSTSIMPLKHASYPLMDSSSPFKRKSKVHKCSICHRIFWSGQALGGHKRCHWVTSTSPYTTTSMPKIQQFEDQTQQVLHQRPYKFMKKSDQTLDLNLPAPVDDIAAVRKDSRNPLSFDASMAIYLKPWIDMNTNGADGDDDYHHSHHHHFSTHNNNNNMNASMHINGDDEADSKVKLAKLSDLKDMGFVGSSSSPWLQVGIGSTSKGHGF